MTSPTFLLPDLAQRVIELLDGRRHPEEVAAKVIRIIKVGQDRR